MRKYDRASHRELVVSPYRLIYRIAGSTVLVVGVFDGRRDLEAVLVQRLAERQ